MSFRVRASESVIANVRRMARDRLDDAVEDLEAAVRGQDVHANVHEARKRNKHVRALTRLVRGSAPDLHDEVNATVRDAARLLSELRDRDAVLETLDELVDHEGRADVADAAAAVRGPLEAARDAAAADAGADIDRALGMFAAVRDGVAAWEVPDDVEALTGGFARTYGRCRDRLADVQESPTTAALHEWRKRVKYHRYHLRILEPVWPRVWGARREAVHDLSDLLGDDHDLAVLRGVFEDGGAFDDGPVRTLVAVLDRRRAELQSAAVPLGERLFAPSPEAAVDELRACWTAWRRESARSCVPRPLSLAAAD